MLCGMNWCVPSLERIRYTAGPPPNPASNNFYVRFPQTRPSRETWPCLAKTAPPAYTERADAQPGMLVASEDLDFCAVCWWSGVSCLQRSATGANEKLCHCAARPGYRDYSALDQSAKKFRAELANSSRLQRHPSAAGGYQIA